MNPQTIALALLVFGLIATRPLEERRWRAGRITDRTSAILVVARLPILVIGFALLTARTPEVALLMGTVSIGLALLALPLVAGRLRRIRAAR
jgi:hypothetical protein